MVAEILSVVCLGQFPEEQKMEMWIVYGKSLELR